MKSRVKKVWFACKILLLALIALFAFYQLWIFGWVVWLNEHQPGSTSFMQIRLQSLRAKDPDFVLKYRWVDYERISNHLKRAILAAEDAKFVDHEGFDWDGIQVALERNQKEGRFVAGGSTISQQLAKNLFLSPNKSLWRKGQEAIITLMLESVMDKRRILELYLNVIEWGNGVFGAEAAARHYYGKSAADLNAEQAARLAAMAPNPRYYEKHRQAPGLNRKTAIILRRMKQAAIP